MTGGVWDPVTAPGSQGKGYFNFICCYHWDISAPHGLSVKKLLCFGLDSDILEVLVLVLSKAHHSLYQIVCHHCLLMVLKGINISI